MPLQIFRQQINADMSDDDLIELLFNQTRPLTAEDEDMRRTRAAALVDLLGGTAAQRASLLQVLEVRCVVA